MNLALNSTSIFCSPQCVCMSEAVMTELLSVRLIRESLCMNDRDAVCDSVAVSSDSRVPSWTSSNSIYSHINTVIIT